LRILLQLRSSPVDTTTIHDRRMQVERELVHQLDAFVCLRKSALSMAPLGPKELNKQSSNSLLYLVPEMGPHGGEWAPTPGKRADFGCRVVTEIDGIFKNLSGLSLLDELSSAEEHSR